MTLRTPPEWATHECTAIAWPRRRALWADRFDAAVAATAQVVRAVAGSERVLLVVDPGDAPSAEREFASDPDVELLVTPIDDSWLRDSGPIVAFDDTGERVGLDFRFNGWGGKFVPFDHDDVVASRILTHLGITRHEADFVLEGGAVCWDGDGTLVTTEQCVLHPNRNGDMSRHAYETEFRSLFGAERVVWLPFGLADDRDTDGHVDMVCLFAGPRTVVAQSVADPSLPDHDRCRRNLAVLSDAGFEVIEMDVFERLVDGDDVVPLSYCNSYITNGAVIVPLAGTASDDRACGILREAFPGRDVIGVDGVTLAWGGGGVHCITQQIPAAPT